MAYSENSTIITYIMVFIASLIGISLLPEFAYQCTLAAANDSVNGTMTETVVNLLPLLYGVICIAGMIGPLYKLFK